MPCEDAHLVGGGQPPGAQDGIRLALALDVEAAPRADAVDEHAQRTAGRHLGVLLAQRAGGRVAGVGEGRLARLDEAGVEVGEGGGREEDLATDLDQSRHVITGQPLGHALDGADVVGHVLAGAPVTSRQRPHEAALLVEEVDGESVDLELGEVVGARADLALDALGPGLELLEGEGVVEAQHALDVVDGLEAGRERGAPDVLRRALGRAQRRVLLLERVEAPDDGWSYSPSLIVGASLTW